MPHTWISIFWNIFFSQNISSIKQDLPFWTIYFFLHSKLINNSDHFVSLNFDLIICPLKAFWWLLSYKSIIVTIIIITNATTILAVQNIRLLYPLHSLYFAFWISTHKMPTCIYLMQDLDKLASLCGQWIWGHISHFIPIWKKNLQLSKHWSSNDFFPFACTWLKDCLEMLQPTKYMENN